ncbi:MAG: prolyl oligopeptidase family serine peptidase [Acidimicrobiales bacterium]
MDDYLAVPRITGLVLAPDGSRLIAPVQTLAPDGKKFLTALWQIDPSGGPGWRLTRSAEGEGGPAFTPEGDVLFVSRRPDPEAEKPPADDERRPGLWRLPAGGGEASVVLERAGGVGSVLVAAASGRTVVTAPALHGDADTDGDRREKRRKLAVSAVLHESSPVRHWDHDLGPDGNRHFAVDLNEETGWTLRDLTPGAGNALIDASARLSDDGEILFTDWWVTHPGGRESVQVVAIDTESGSSTVLSAVGRDFSSPAVAPDGSWLVFVDCRTETPDTCPSYTLSIVYRQGGDGPDGDHRWAPDERRDLLPGFALWPRNPVTGRGSDAVYFTADEDGHSPVFRVEVATGEVTRLTRSGAYSNLCPSPDGNTLYALRNHIDSPARPVRLDARQCDQDPVFLAGPGEVGQLPGRLDEVTTVAGDGTAIRAWLAHPDSPEPAPLLLWVHGGPLASWNTWSWRWNPWLMVARGWAVLLPDPGLSTGYGDAMVQRAWGKWGPVPFADIMAVTDAAVARPDIDGERTAMMGGSYGGYMANWVAGHTDRFGAIVTHASLWSLGHFIGTTDHPGGWTTEWRYPDEAPERYELNSPHLHWDSISTPILVIHGDKDYRVPVGEGLDLWTALVRNQVPAKFLYFPDEGHWILKPGNVRLWYETVHVFLEHYVLGKEWVRPELL